MGCGVNVVGTFGAAGFAVVAGGDAVAVGGAEAPHYPAVFDHGLKRLDPSFKPAIFRVGEGLRRGSGTV